MIIKSFIAWKLMLPVLSILTLAHSWYPPSCCGGQDCKPIPCENISQDGNYYSIPSEGITHSYVIKQPSPDNQCHVCIGHTGDKPFIRCLYYPIPAT